MVQLSDQLSLLPEEPYEHPHRWRDRHYVPILKSMPGELTALREASTGTWERMTPLIEAMGRADIDEPPARSRFPNLATHLGLAIASGRPFFLDFPGLDSRAKVNVKVGSHRIKVNVVEHVFERCRNSGLTFIPVVAIGADAHKASLVRAAQQRDRRGVCLRVPITGVFWEGSLGTAVDAALADVGLPPDKASLLLDLRYLPTPLGVDVATIADLINKLPHLHQWSSLIVAGTVIPSTAAGWEEGGITELPRHEWSLYQQLQTHPPDRMPAFGDYAVQHPDPPENGGPGMRGSIRYTTQELVLFARGYSVLEQGTDQYRELCGMLAGRPEFSGAGYTWGDTRIASTARGSDRPPGEPAWRAAGTSHHLRFVADSLAA